MQGRLNVGQPLANGRYGGGTAGSEHRYSYTAVDLAKWDQATRGADVRGKWQGEAGQVIGAYVNTMQAPRGKIMGAMGPGNPGTGQLPDRAFTGAGQGPRPNAGMNTGRTN